MIVSCKSILDEVAKATAYLGAKRGQYERLATVDANDEILVRYWRQAVAAAAIALGPAAETILTENPTPTATFTLASAIDPALAESMVRAYLIESVVDKWLALTGIEPSAEGTNAISALHINASGEKGLASLASLARSCTRPLSPF